MNILAVESSCDETAVAIVRDGRQALCDCIASQVDLHRLYGGVVPEIASRKHMEAIYALADQALIRAGMTRKDLDAVAVTYAPGLIGAVLVGVNFAKAAALALEKPLIPVHHIRGHIAANYLAYPDLEPPFLCLVVSGGHTMIVDVQDYTRMQILGTTLDDAAGECFDKVARVLGMPYPGGAALDRQAQQGDPTKYSLPRSKPGENPYNMSFSGLKTAALNLIHHAQQVGQTLDIPSLCASFSEAVADNLVPRVTMALEQTGYRLRKADEVIRTAYGTTAEKINLLTGLLNGAGYQAEPMVSLRASIAQGAALKAIGQLYVKCMVGGDIYLFSVHSQMRPQMTSFNQMPLFSLATGKRVTLAIPEDYRIQGDFTFTGEKTNWQVAKQVTVGPFPNTSRRATILSR